MRTDRTEDSRSDIQLQDQIKTENKTGILDIWNIELSNQPVIVDIDRSDLDDEIRKKAKEVMVEIEKNGKKEGTFLVKTSLGEIIMFTVSAVTGTTGIVYTVMYSTVSPATACLLIGMGVSCMIVPFIFKSGTTMLDKVYNVIKYRFNAN